MRSLRFIGVMVAALLVLAGHAWAVGVCVAGCGAQAHVCAQAGRLAQVPCASGCRQNTGLGAGIECARGCARTASAAVRACATDAKTCKASCAPAPDVDDTCLESCGTALTACLSPTFTAPGVLSTAQANGAGCGDSFTTCVAACPTAAPDTSTATPDTSPPDTPTADTSGP